MPSAKRNGSVSTLKNVGALIVSVAVSEAAGIVGTAFTAPNIPTWYASLARPALSPPNWLFAPVWISLYACMGVAAFLVWRSAARREDVRLALAVFGMQLVLNASWSFVFFGLRNPAFAFAVIVAYWLSIICVMIRFCRISKPAAWLLVPLLLWVTFAAYLNAAIWLLN
jgi:tryptophan-rich sensory protein